METCYHVPERRETAEKREENDGAYTCYSKVCRPFLTKSFPWKQEDTVNPRINCRLCSRITTDTLKIQIPENPRVSRRKEILKIEAEVNAKETKETRAKINKAKSWFFERINKIDKPLARLIKKKGRRIKSIKLEMKMEKS